MRGVRRVAFAAPFVIVVACKKPVAEPRDPDDEDEEDEQAEIVPPRSAASEPPPDAYVPEVVAIDAALPPDARDWGIDRCTDRRVPARDKVGCNPPPPRCGEQGVTCNPPRPVIGHVLRVEVQGSGTIVTIDRGSNEGITTEWKACLAKPNDDCVSAGQLVLIRVDKKTTNGRSTATFDQITATPRVKLTPP